MNIKQIAHAVCGQLNLNDAPQQEINIKGVSTDSRENLEGCLFVPLKGEKFDGHNYIDMAFEKGAVCCLTEQEIFSDKPLIKVSSTYEALKSLAEYYLGLFNENDLNVVAITGSSGKTTTKDLIASVLSQKYNVKKNIGNLNNEIGLPLTVFKIDKSTQCAVLEMGMNNFGEIHNLSKIAKPNICVITNIGVAHIANLGSREGILKAKSEIFNYMKQNGIAILNAEDDLLLTLKDKLKNTIYYGFGKENDIYASNIKHNGLFSTQCTINYNFSNLNLESFEVNIPSPGEHMVLNALAAAAVGFCLKLSPSEIKTGIEAFSPSKMRMNIATNENRNITVINDAYNANPQSMKAAIDVLCSLQTKGRKVCIFGDMLELGQLTGELHYEVGQYALSKNVDCVICVGQNSQTYEAVKNSLTSFYFENRQQLIEKLTEVILPDDVVLVKGSRGAGLEQIVQHLFSSM